MAMFDNDQHLNINNQITSSQPINIQRFLDQTDEYNMDNVKYMLHYEKVRIYTSMSIPFQSSNPFKL